MHIYRHGLAVWRFGMGFKRLTNHRAKSQIGHIVVVHHIKMDPIRTRSNDIFYLIAQASKIG